MDYRFEYHSQEGKIAAQDQAIAEALDLIKQQHHFVLLVFDDDEATIKGVIDSDRAFDLGIELQNIGRIFLEEAYARALGIIDDP